MTRSRDIADQQDNLGGAVAPFVAGKNKIINGDFGIWQRGTTFTGVGNSVYTADRWCTESNGASTVTQQTFTAGSAPVAGYAGQYFLRQQVTSPSTVSGLNYRIEDIRTLSGQTATISFWAKAASTTALTFIASQFFVAAQQDNMSTTFSIGTTWQRYTFTGTIGSIAGFTLPNPNYLSLRFLVLTNTAYTLDIWGVQLEAGSQATPFTTASGSIGGELALCQRYYHRFTGGGATDSLIGSGLGFATTVAMFVWNLGTTMRTAPSAMDLSNQGIYRPANATSYSGGTWALNQAFDNSVRVIYTHGSAVFTAGESLISASTSATNYIGFSAEL